jgi:hypothetical protein
MPISQNCCRERRKPVKNSRSRVQAGSPQRLSLARARDGFGCVSRPLTELHGVGPFIAEKLRIWIENPPLDEMKPPAIRRDFLTRADALAGLAKNPDWSKKLRGDLQMHTQWSDGSACILEMAQAAKERGYEYIAITDHSKGLKIAGGIDEKALTRQALEIAEANAAMRPRGVNVLRSIEMNLNPRGEGDMDRKSLAGLDFVLGAFHSALRTKEDQTIDILPRCETQMSRFSVIRAGAFTIIESD